MAGLIVAVINNEISVCVVRCGDVKGFGSWLDKVLCHGAQRAALVFPMRVYH